MITDVISMLYTDDYKIIYLRLWLKSVQCYIKIALSPLGIFTLHKWECGLWWYTARHVIRMIYSFLSWYPEISALCTNTQPGTPRTGTDDSSNMTVASKTIHLHSVQAIQVLSLTATYHTISCKPHFNANYLVVGNDNKIPWRKEENRSHILCTDDQDDVIKWKHLPFVRGIHRSPA